MAQCYHLSADVFVAVERDRDELLVPGQQVTVHGQDVEHLQETTTEPDPSKLCLFVLLCHELDDGGIKVLKIDKLWFYKG